MILEDLVQEIKVDLGCDINSLGISDQSIQMKIKEALRKISSYAPYVCIEMFPINGGYCQLPEDTTTVIEVANLDNPQGTPGSLADDQDLFTYSRYIYSSGNGISDPYTFIMQKNQVKTLQNFVSMKDYRFEKSTHKLYLSNVQTSKVCIKYLRKYRTIEEIEDTELLQMVKEYALALCKIVEGNIRRKLQSAPGAIQMDGDSLVNEGTQEKQRIEDQLAEGFQNLRFGIRA